MSNSTLAQELADSAGHWLTDECYVSRSLLIRASQRIVEMEADVQRLEKIEAAACEVYNADQPDSERDVTRYLEKLYALL